MVTLLAPYPQHKGGHLSLHRQVVAANDLGESLKEVDAHVTFTKAFGPSEYNFRFRPLAH